jgi:hypothetical protein
MEADPLRNDTYSNNLEASESYAPKAVLRITQKPIILNRLNIYAHFF